MPQKSDIQEEKGCITQHLEDYDFLVPRPFRQRSCDPPILRSICCVETSAQNADIADNQLHKYDSQQSHSWRQAHILGAMNEASSADAQIFLVLSSLRIGQSLESCEHDC